jgi:hypothetical protein
MMKQTTSGPSPDSDFNGRSAKPDDPSRQLVPLYLSRNGDEPDPSEFTSHLRKQRRSASSRILASVLVASVIAIMFALFSSDNMRKIIADAKTLIAFMRPAPSRPSQPDFVKLTAEEIELLRGPAQLPKPVVATPPQEIPSAYQSAAQSQVPTAAAPAAPATKELSDSAKDTLFKEFLAWEAERKARAQIRSKKAKRPAPRVVKRSPSRGRHATR